MQSNYWYERWRVGQGCPPANRETNLEKYWPILGLSPHALVLVPLCGKSQDLAWLSARGYSVLGVEYSAIAAEDFFLENGIPAQRRSTGSLVELIDDRLHILIGDIFDLAAHLPSPLDAIYDRAALVALSPEMTLPYAQHLTGLSTAGSNMLLI